MQIESKIFAGTLNGVPVHVISEEKANLIPLKMRASDQRAYLSATEIEKLKAILQVKYGWKPSSA